MTQFNPFVGSILQSSQVARQQAVNKAAQVRRSQQVQRNVAAREDEFEFTVESSEELSPTHDREGDGKRRDKKKDEPEDGKPHVDLRA